MFIRRYLVSLALPLPCCFPDQLERTDLLLRHKGQQAVMFPSQSCCLIFLKSNAKLI